MRRIKGTGLLGCGSQEACSSEGAGEDIGSVQLPHEAIGYCWMHWGVGGSSE